MASKGGLCNLVNGFCTHLQSFGFPQGCVCVTFGHFFIISHLGLEQQRDVAQSQKTPGISVFVRRSC